MGTKLRQLCISDDVSFTLGLLKTMVEAQLKDLRYVLDLEPFPLTTTVQTYESWYPLRLIGRPPSVTEYRSTVGVKGKAVRIQAHDSGLADAANPDLHSSSGLL